MSDKLWHHRDCPWRPPHDRGADEPVVLGPVCECDALWTRDRDHGPEAGLTARPHGELAAHLRAEDGPESDLEAFREAAGTWVRLEAARLVEVELRRELAASQATCAMLDEQLTQTRNARDLDVQAFQGMSMKLTESRRTAAEWERIAAEWELDYVKTLDERDAARSDLRQAQSMLSSLDSLLDLARQNSALDAADLDEALAEATRLAEVLTERWAEATRLEAENEVLADQRDDLRREVIAVRTEMAEPGERTIQAYVCGRSASDGWLTLAQQRRVLDQADVERDAGLAEVRRLTVELAFVQDTGITRVLTERWDDDREPPNGTIIVDAAHIAWQRRDSDADSFLPELRWLEAGSEQSCDWSAVIVAGPVTVVWSPPASA